MQEFYKNDNVVKEINEMLAGTAKVVFELPNEYFPDLDSENELER